MKKTYSLFFLWGILSLHISFAQRDFSQVQIKTHRVTDHIYMLEGSGGNIGICIGEDGILMIDSQFEGLSAKVKAAINELQAGDVRFLINTHLHGDHIGGNVPIAEQGGVILAHSSVRERISKEMYQAHFDRTTPPSPKAARPLITFEKNLSLHLNGEDIEVYHGPSAHTDGDAVVYFKTSNVIHTGDVFVRYGFPFIDADNGGSINGFIAYLDELLEMTDSQTRIIPGHGQIANKADVQTLRKDLAAIRDQFMQLVEEGKSLEEILNAGITDPYEEMGKGFINAQSFVTLMWHSLKNEEE